MSVESVMLSNYLILCHPLLLLPSILPSIRVKVKSESRLVVSDSLWSHGLYSPWNSPGQNTGAFPFSRGSSPPRDQTHVSRIAGGCFTSWATSIFPSIRVSCNESVLRIRWPKLWRFSISPSKNIQAWFPLGLTGLISLQSKGLSKVFSNTTIQKHQFLLIRCYKFYTIYKKCPEQKI